jgi:DNA polymerase III alpha subunit
MYLNCHSYYSLRYGTMSVEQLVNKAIEAEADTIALTDINNSTGMPEFVTECNKHSIKPITGIEFRNGNDLLYIGIAANNNGIRELNEFLTRHNINGTIPEFPPQQFNDSYVI